MQQNHLCDFERGHHGEYSCEVIWNLDHWFKRRHCLKTFLISSSDSPFVQQTQTICVILVEGIMRNKSVKFLPGALAALLFGGDKPFMQF